MPEDHARTLVVADTCVGDIVMDQTLLALLKLQAPNTPLDVAAPVWAGELMARMPQVDRHVPLEINHMSPAKWVAARRMLRGRYTQAILIPRSVTAAALLRFSGIRKRTGFEQVRPGLLNDLRGRSPGNFRDRMIRLAPSSLNIPNPLPLPRLQINRNTVPEVLARFQLDAPRQPLCALAPGTAPKMPTKRWPIGRFKALARLLLREGYQICVMGGRREQPLAAELASIDPNRITNLCGRTSIGEAADIMAGADIAVCNDSGLLHVSAAVGTPVLGIYGPTSPEKYPPLSDRSAVIWQRTPCSPCYRPLCPYGNHACMNGITPEQVMNEISRFRLPTASVAAATA